MAKNWFEIGFIIFIALLILVPAVLLLRLYIHDVKQKEHSVLRNYPILGKMRYILEKIGPELRQYLFLNNQEGKPFNRNQYEIIVQPGKYNTSMMSFGAERKFEKDQFYLVTK